MKLTREIKTALLLIGCISIFIFGFSFLGGKSLFKTDKEVIAFYDEAEGLEIGAKVTLNGLTIGKVTSIELSPDLNGIQVVMGIRNDLKFSNQSKAILYEPGLIGGKAIAIEPDFSKTSIFESGDIFPSSKKPGLTELLNSQIVPLQNKIESMIVSADSVLTSVNNILNPDSQKNLQNTIANLSTSIENIDKISSQLTLTLSDNKVSIDKTFKNFKNSSENLSKISDSLAKIEFGSTINEFRRVGTQLNVVLEKIASEQGSMGKLISDEELYKNLAASTKSLEELLSDLKENPKRYVHFSLFGRKEKKQDEQ